MFTKAGVIAQTHKTNVYVVTDSDAIAFLSATSITDPTISQAIDVLVIAAKAHGWWSKCIAIYPMVGGTATTCKYNLKNPSNTDAAFRLNFVNSPTITSTGVDWNGTNQYADTFIQPSTHLTIQDTHLSFYSRENVVSNTEIAMGAYNDGETELLLQPAAATAGFFSDQYNNVNTQGRLEIANSDSRGFYIGSRVSSTNHKIYRNGELWKSAITSVGSLPTTTILLSAIPDGGGGQTLFGTRQCAFATIGSGLTHEIASYMSDDVEAFQTFLTRDVEPDAAQEFIDATGISDGTQISAIQTLVAAAKSHGWWYKCVAIYPFVGGNATKHKYNLKSPRDTDSSFRLTFNGSVTHSSNGVISDGSSGYIDTHLIPSYNLIYNNTHMSFYSRTNSADTGGDWGVQSNASQRFRMILQSRYPTDIQYHDHYSAVGANEMGITGVTDSRGWMLSSRLADNDLVGYRNGSSIGNSTNVDGSSGLPTASMKMLALDLDGVISNYSSRECAFATVGDGIDSTLAATMYTDIQAFQTTLGRQV